MDIYVSYTCLKITSVFHITLKKSFKLLLTEKIWGIEVLMYWQRFFFLSSRVVSHCTFDNGKMYWISDLNNARRGDSAVSNTRRAGYKTAHLHCQKQNSIIERCAESRRIYTNINNKYVYAVTTQCALSSRAVASQRETTKSATLYTLYAKTLLSFSLSFSSPSSR